MQQPVATYRIHEDNLSLKNRILEVKEYKNWYKRNKQNLNHEEKNVIQKNKYLRVLSYKFEKSFLKPYVFLSRKKNIYYQLKIY